MTGNSGKHASVATSSADVTKGAWVLQENNELLQLKTYRTNSLYVIIATKRGPTKLN